MKKIVISFILGVFLCCLFFLGRNLGNAHTLVPKSHVVVRLEVETSKPINWVMMTTTHSTQSIGWSDQKETMMVFPNPGEGEFTLCCQFEDGTHICSP